MLNKITIFLISIVLIKTHGDRMVGGFEKKHTNEECENVLKTVLTEHLLFADYSIKSCETQLVNGLNYRMVLVNPEKDIKKCKITVYQSFDKTETKALKYREKEEDCFTMFENAKISTTGL
jgi:hypothetical protein